jgi:hypothetical protein
MTTVILIAILLVLLILACTFGLLKKSKKKDRRDPFADVMTTLSSMPPGPFDPSIIGGQYMNQSNNPQFNAFLTQQDQQQQYQQQQSQGGQSQRGSYPQVYQQGFPSSGYMTGDPRFASKYTPYGPMGMNPSDPRWLTQGIAPGLEAGAMGSAQAEFQNDFIEVFPMQHLEPKPDLN